MLAVLVWRLPEVRWSDLGPRWRSTSAVWLVAAGLTMSAAFALSTLRWRRVLVAMRPAPRYRRMLSHFLAGQFVSNVLPTAFGGDVIRVSRLGRDIGDHPTAFASVTIERMTGWLVLPLISGVALLAQPDLLSLGSATALAVAIDGGTIVALVVVLLVGLVIVLIERDAVLFSGRCVLVVLSTLPRASAPEPQIERTGTCLLQLPRFFEAAMTTLLHGRAPNLESLHCRPLYRPDLTTGGS